MIYWLDTEFIEDGKTIDLISIGVVAEDGREFYAESNEVDLSKADEWVRNNVITHLWSLQPDKREANLWSRNGGKGGLLSRMSIASELLSFCDSDKYGKPEFWGYYADYDWVVLCQLFGRMIDLPKGWPKYCRDIKQWCATLGNPQLPKQDGSEHHALADARWNRQAFYFLRDMEIQDLDETNQLNERLSTLLTKTADILKGPPGPLELHSWHDLPEVALQMRKLLDSHSCNYKQGHPSVKEPCEICLWLKKYPS